MSEQTKRILEIFEEIKWQVEADFQQKAKRASVEPILDADHAAIKKAYDQDKDKHSGDYAKDIDKNKLTYEASVAVLEKYLKEIVHGAVQKLKLNVSDEDVETLYQFFKKNKAERLQKDYQELKNKGE